MAEPNVADCPRTPEVLPVTSTPPARQGVTYSSSSDEAEEQGDGRRSPPPKCAICLGKCRQPSYTDSCRHTFCFHCLLEWSKVKPECPLCKQEFLAIVYYKSADNCPQKHLVTRPIGHNQMRSSDMYHTWNFLMAEPQRITYHTTLRVRPTQGELLQQLFMHQSSDVQRFVREFGNQPIPSRDNQVEWRRFIYVQRLYARPLPDINGYFRETSASYYRENDYALTRMLPWVNRELYVLSSLCVFRRPNGSEIVTLMEQHDVESSTFTQFLTAIPIQYRAHFHHELVNFARSPNDMHGYDRSVQYNPQYGNPHHTQRRFSPRVVISSSEPEDDEIIYLPSTVPAPAAETAAAAGSSTSASSSSSNNSSTSTSTSTSSNATASNTCTASTNGTSNGANGSSGGTSSTSTSNSAANTEHGTSRLSSRRAERMIFHMETRSLRNTVTMAGTLDELDVSQEAVPITVDDARTATPVIVVNDDYVPAATSASGTVAATAAAAGFGTLPSGSSTLRDGDNISLSSTDSDECQFVREQKPPHLRTPDHVVDLESASDSDVVFVDEGVMPGPKLPATGEGVSGEQDHSENGLKKETGNPPSYSSEFNHGASTSSGYSGGGALSCRSVASCSGTSGLRFVAQKVTRYAGGMGMKSIYEASDTDDSSDSDDKPIVTLLPRSKSTSSSSHDEVVFRSVQQKSTVTASAGVSGGTRSRKRKRVPKRLPQLRGRKKVSRGRAKDSSSYCQCTDSSSSQNSSRSSSSSSNSSTTVSSSRSSSSSDSSGSSRSSCSSSSSSSNTSSISGIRSRSASTDSSSSSSSSSNISKHVGTKARKSSAKRKRKNRLTAESSLNRAQQQQQPPPPPSTSAKIVLKAKPRRAGGRKTAKVVAATECQAKGSAKDVPARSHRRNRSKKEARVEPSGSKGAAERTKNPTSTTTTTTTKSSKRKKAKAKASQPVTEVSRASTSGDKSRTAGAGGGSRRRSKRGADAMASAETEAWVSGRAQYFVETRPSCSPTIDAPPAETRKLKSVIIKRCHYGVDKPLTIKITTTSTTCCSSTAMPSTDGVGTVAEEERSQMDEASPPKEARPPTEAASTGGQGEPNGATVELMQLSSNGSDSGSDTDLQDENAWNGEGLQVPADAAPPDEHHQQQQQQQQQQNLPPVPEPEPLTAQSTEDQFQLSAGGGEEATLMEQVEEESNSFPSESLFAPSLSWLAADEPEPPAVLAIAAEERLSSAAASPFSSVSFPPSTTSVSTPSPSLSLAVPTSASPVDLLDVVGTLDGESPLLSSIVDIGTIDATIDEIMRTEQEQEEDVSSIIIRSAITNNNTPGPGAACEPAEPVEPPECGNVLGVGPPGSGTVGAEVEL